jgi:hypothetical protein
MESDAFGSGGKHVEKWLPTRLSTLTADDSRAGVIYATHYLHYLTSHANWTFCWRVHNQLQYMGVVGMLCAKQSHKTTKILAWVPPSRI